MKVSPKDQWLYRTDEGDFGPVPTKNILAGIEAKKIDLRTELLKLGTRHWESAATYALFREHYASCQEHWEKEERYESYDKSNLRQKRLRSSVFVTGLLALLVLGTLLFVYRDELLYMTGGEGVGFASAALVLDLPELPPVKKKKPHAPELPIPSLVEVPILSETPYFDTRGVMVSDADKAAPQRMAFSLDGGSAEGLSGPALQKVLNQAQSEMHRCVSDLAAKSPAFSKTEISFSVSSGRLTKLRVGQEVARYPAFQSCVKKGLSRVSVPSFQGNEKRVTLPVLLRG